jgi:hypothetical protein
MRAFIVSSVLFLIVAVGIVCDGDDTRLRCMTPWLREDVVVECSDLCIAGQ